VAYSYIEQQWAKKSPVFKDWLRQVAIGWRRDPVVKRLNRPTRLDRARRLGYKPQQGIVVVRVRVRRGGARKSRPGSGRRQKAMGVVGYTRAMSRLEIAENRAGRKYPNLRVANSYHLYSDGKNHWYEVILRDPFHPAQR
jgi:large subunit ribosomal protein L15e